ncbi:hypothetical protein [Methylobacterium oxalidis]|uniref:Uncharacterized protein n=1 Tax=Methylobacterium oxalidis TaxID=944322 RepID=A0A512J3A9_9HYPH|nr:hypothetical protein [Methylobacterium oxalidis]GEP04467.1 hypothetical protein MOX02_25050 [Methylobacterium oxalidis]GJE32099.1 hypothetical protein LDDCCGHA_2281 [Methylobacterium oxalidis]GLS62839.1 hypothetical protein GCM10007888_12200 [Methylobacterium oxalidis]
MHNVAPAAYDKVEAEQMAAVAAVTQAMWSLATVTLPQAPGTAQLSALNSAHAAPQAAKHSGMSKLARSCPPQ